MKRLLCPQLPKAHRPATLPEDEANHAVRVLRLRDGDSVEAIDGQGHSVPAILRTHGGAVRLELAAANHPAEPRAAHRRNSRDGEPEVVPLVLEIAALKGEAMEWVVEKCVELGVRELAPLLTAHTVVQVSGAKGKGPEVFRERWQKIADQALKQCGRLDRLVIHAPVALEAHLAASAGPRFWCDERAGDPAADLGTQLQAVSGEVRLLIGPEGGWSEEERSWLAKSATRVGLGPLILRAETAALYAVSLAACQLRAASRLTRKDS